MENIKEISTVWGALFSVSRNIIHKKPKIFYEHLLRYVNYHVNPEEGHFFERCWYFIFQNDYIKKDILNVYSIYDLKQFFDEQVWKLGLQKFNFMENPKFTTLTTLYDFTLKIWNKDTTQVSNKVGKFHPYPNMPFYKITKKLIARL